jgi:hypothetical protein
MCSCPLSLPYFTTPELAGRDNDHPFAQVRGQILVAVGLDNSPKRVHRARDSGISG